MLESNPIQIHLKENRASGAVPLLSPPEIWQKPISSPGWLSASIVHDLRNPLATVFAGAEMLMQLDSASPQVNRLANNIYRAADRIRGLLADLADASCGNKTRREVCRIRDVVAAASKASFPAAKAQSVQIVLDVPQALETTLERSHIERVFFNLIINAVEAMPHGGTVRIGARKADNYMLIAVEDTGPGIPREIRGQLFEPFVTAGKDHGLGLGLAFSRQIVLEHGGDMWNEAAAGGRFVVRLPLKPTHSVPCQEANVGRNASVNEKIQPVRGIGRRPRSSCPALQAKFQPELSTQSKIPRKMG